MPAMIAHYRYPHSFNGPVTYGERDMSSPGTTYRYLPTVVLYLPLTTRPLSIIHTGTLAHWPGSSG
jgi:hypothetical protein